jgi:hypothetical protein
MIAERTEACEPSRRFSLDEDSVVLRVEQEVAVGWEDKYVS